MLANKCIIYTNDLFTAHDGCLLKDMRERERRVDEIFGNLQRMINTL
jgi:phosphate uptake regulator